MKKCSDKTHALAMAIVNTFTAVLIALVTLFRYADPFQIVLTVLWAVTAIFWWRQYTKQQQEEEYYE
ncbi:hypothetical protein D7V91_01480 [bacterium 1xD42-67]|nr:hypothetical protein D7V91_01480 [bacterium 1xD42-67]